MWRRGWTAELFGRYGGVISLPSMLRLRAALIRKETSEIRVSMCSPWRGDLWLRPCSSDIDTFREIVFERVYEPVVSRLSNCETVIDLGANIGLSAQYFLSTLPNCRVFAVEPVQESCRLLARNLECAGKGRGRWIRAAAWEDGRSLSVHAEYDTDRFDSYCVHEGEASQSERVTGLSVAQIIDLSGFSKVDLLKVDIEGAERNLFKGHAAWLECVNAICIEFHGDSRQESGFDRKVADHGFQIMEANHHTVLAVRGSAAVPVEQVCGKSAMSPIISS